MERPPEQKEQGPGSYEYALERFRRLKDRGRKEPFDSEDPEALDAIAALDAWEAKSGAAMQTIGGMEGAKLKVKAIRVPLEAGFTGKAVKADIKERLDDLYAQALNEKDPEVIAYVASELEQFEPKSAAEKAVEAKLAEAASAKPVDAVGILTLALFDPRFKRMGAALRQRLEQVRDEYKKKI